MILSKNFDFKQINFESLTNPEKNAIRYCLEIGRDFCNQVCGLAEKEIPETLIKLYKNWGFDKVDFYIQEAKDQAMTEMALGVDNESQKVRVPNEYIGFFSKNQEEDDDF